MKIILMLIFVYFISIGISFADFKAPQPNNGKDRALNMQSKDDPVRLRELIKIAESTVELSMSHIGPIRAVSMQKLREVYPETSYQDIQILIKLISNKGLSTPAHQAVKYLIAMSGDKAKVEMDKVAAESSHGSLISDFSDIRLYMQSQPWNK